MTGSFQVVVLYSVFGSAFGFFENIGFFEQHKGYQLVNSVFHSLRVDTVMDCTMECVENNLCKSLNYQHSNNDVKQCHLNNRTKRSAPAADFKSDPGITYYEKDPCVPSPCLSVATAYACSRDNSDDGFQCSCAPGYQGRRCQERYGWSPSNPAKSCQDILTNGHAVHDGKYWIDPGNAGNAIPVFCDMSKDQGGWLLISNVVIQTSGSVPSLTTLSSSYRDIANYNNNVTILSASALGQLHQLINFTQLRFHCQKSAVGRTINLITVNIDVVNYFAAVSNVRPAACNSFQRGTGDNSKIADVCSQWGYTGIWSSGSRINEWRLHDHSFFVEKKYHWINKDKLLKCDSQNSAISPGDYWKIYVR